MYHLSFSNLGYKFILEPKKPNRSYANEKRLPDRVCFSPTVEKCVYGVEGVVDSNKEEAFKNIVQSIEFYKNMIISDYPELFATNKMVFPDHNIDIINNPNFNSFPNIAKKHFLRKYYAFIDLYREHVFSDKYTLDRETNFFEGVNKDNFDNMYLNLTCYQTREPLIKPDSVADFKETEEMWSLRPILVERVGFISTLHLMKGEVVFVDNNITIKYK